MPTVQNLKTFAKVRLSDGALVATGLRQVPKQIRTWVQTIGPSAQFDPRSALPDPTKCPAEHDGFGYFPEAEVRADFDPATQRLGDLAAGALDLENSRVAYARPAVSLTQAELDAIAAGVVQQRDARAAALTTGVKAAAEAARGRFITSGSGKALEYEAKRSEATSYGVAKAAASPSAPTVNGTLYPWAHETAKALAGGEPSTAQITAQCELFLARAVAWEAIGRQIAGKEQAAVEAIEAARAAGDDAAMEAAAVVVWPTPS